MPKEKCRPGCTCYLHRKCPPGCACGRHRTSFAYARTTENATHLRKLAAQGVGGQNRTKEWRQKVSEALTGRPLDEERRRKITEINRDPARIKQRSDARKARRKTAETHEQMHRRLRRDRGPAKNYPCFDCGEPARDWSHSCLTWEGTAQEILNRHGKRLVFSTDPDAYHARCKPCHRRLDAGVMPWSLLPADSQGATKAIV